jgi:hypothetical protein
MSDHRLWKTHRLQIPARRGHLQEVRAATEKEGAGRTAHQRQGEGSWVGRGGTEIMSID